MYTIEQQRFIDSALNGKNIFLTGKAGTGKTFIVKELIKKLKKEGKNVITVAPTGVAANNAGGATIHSTFSLPISGVLKFETCNFLKSQKKSVIDNTDVLLIDEVSMVRPDILDGINWTLLKNGCKKLMNMQVILIGDMMQLKPVIDDNTKSVLLQSYQGTSFKHSLIYPKLLCEEIELTEVVRQSDPEFIENLNIIRDGGKSEYFRSFLIDDPDNYPDSIILAPHNSTVKRYNIDGLAKINEEEIHFPAFVEGNAKQSDFTLEFDLKLKHGCKVMYLVNSQADNNLVNGTLGTFIIRDGLYFIKVGEIEYELEKVRQSKKEYVFDEKEDKMKLVETASIRQYPVKLAYAISIHKSQGLTFDNMILDLTLPCFADGQMYVALSRVRTTKGLSIYKRGLSPA